MILTADDVTAFRRRGYLHQPGLFSAKRVSAVRDASFAIFAGQMTRLGITVPNRSDGPDACAAMAELFAKDRVAFINCGKHSQNLMSLHRLGLDPLIEERLSDLGQINPNICTRPVLFFNHRALAEQDVYYKTPSHQDWLSMDGSLNLIVVWVPLVDVPIPLGALQIAPKSHLHGLYEPPNEAVGGFTAIKEFPEDCFIDVEVKAGDALFFSGLLVHRSGNNVSDRIRWSCHFRYNDLAESTFIARGYPSPYTYRPTQERVWPRFPDAQIARDYFNTDERQHGPV